MKENEVRQRAFAMPLTSPAYPIGPYRFINREYLVITYRTDPKKLRELVPGSSRLFNCCVDLGWKAENTLGNAEETAAWARSKGYRRIIVVTADFHMPRALLELRAVMPEAAFIPHPVATEQFTARDWERRPRTARFMIGEYNKYLVVLAREAFLALGPRDAPPAEAARAATS